MGRARGQLPGVALAGPPRAHSYKHARPGPSILAPLLFLLACAPLTPPVERAPTGLLDDARRLLDDPASLADDQLAALAARPHGAAPTLPALTALADRAAEPAQRARLLGLARAGLLDADAWFELGALEADAWREAGEPRLALDVLVGLWRAAPELPAALVPRRVALRHRALLAIWALDPHPEHGYLPPLLDQLAHLAELGKHRMNPQLQDLSALLAIIGAFDPERDAPLLKAVRVLHVPRRKREPRPPPADASDPMQPLRRLLAAEAALVDAHTDPAAGLAALEATLDEGPIPDPAAWRLEAARLALDLGDRAALDRHLAAGLAAEPAEAVAAELRWTRALAFLLEARYDEAAPILRLLAAGDEHRRGEYVTELSATAPPARALYWLGRLHERRADAEEARRAWGEVARRFPFSPYHLLARDGLRRLGDEPPALTASLPAPRPLSALDEALDLDALRYGLPEQVAAAPRPLDAAIWRAFVHHPGRRAFPGDLARFDLPDPREQLPPIAAAARPQQLDPVWVLALIRNESRFRADACSASAACGLMQIKERTARLVARRNDLDLDEAQLHDPTTNLSIGCALLADLEEHFDGDPLRALAAYNAGAGAVQRWGLETLSTDLFLEAMKDRRTRAYVLGIMTRYALYVGLLARGQPRALVAHAALP